jgi:hypothetical protein
MEVVVVDGASVGGSSISTSTFRDHTLAEFEII